MSQLMSSCLNLNSLSINFQPGESNKRPFVFVHGNTQNDTCGKAIIEFFRLRGHTTLSYDLPGHGDSKLDKVDYRFADLIDLNYRVLTLYQLHNPILCGHSLGGMIQAGTIAQFKLSAASLILCGSFDGNPILEEKRLQGDQGSTIEQSLNDYVAESKQLFEAQFKYDYFANRQLSDDLVEVINRRYTQPDANAANLKTLGSFSARAELVDMAIPILILHGVEETVIPKSLIDTMAAHYKKIRLAWYEGYGHNAFYQAPELTNDYLAQYYDFINLLNS
ncbi:alpha/beta fold hydrolase [Aliikangiella coralliicola]|nr:alpha/beta hydrolase [Aliikangiella coralliicola]